MFIHAKNACWEIFIKGHSCYNCSIKSIFFGVGGNKALVFPDYCSVQWFIQIQTLLLPFSKALHLKAFPAIDSCLTQSSLQLKLLYKLNAFPGPLIHVSAFKYVFLRWKKTKYKIFYLLQTENPKINSRKKCFIWQPISYRKQSCEVHRQMASAGKAYSQCVINQIFYKYSCLFFFFFF